MSDDAPQPSAVSCSKCGKSPRYMFPRYTFEGNNLIGFEMFCPECDPRPVKPIEPREVNEHDKQLARIVSERDALRVEVAELKAKIRAHPRL